MFYFGKICADHPEEGGRRYISCRKCVPCHNIIAAKSRRNTVKTATPEWADKKAISAVYRKANKAGKVVDHVIPLNHPKVCGLHVHNNLKIISGPDNLSKGNRFRIMTVKTPKE